MRKSRLVLTLAVGAMVLAPATVLAGRDHSGRGGDHGHRVSGAPGFKAGHGHDGFREGRHGFKGHDGFRDGRHGKGHDGFRDGRHGFKGHDKHRHGVGFFPVVTLYVPPLYYGYGYGYGGYGYGAPVYGPPPVYYPPAYAAAPVYPPAPVYAASAATLSLAPAPPMPRVLEYPNGRFELHGDGITSAHTWVWIPNAPPPPPEPAPAPSAPPRETERVQPASGDGTRARLSPLYRWTDEQGVVHITNRPEAVPRGHGAQPKRVPTL